MIIWLYCRTQVQSVSPVKIKHKSYVEHLLGKKILITAQHFRGLVTHKAHTKQETVKNKVSGKYSSKELLVSKQINACS